MKRFIRPGLVLLFLHAGFAASYCQDFDFLSMRIGYTKSMLIYRPGNIEASVNDFNLKTSTTTQMELPKYLSGMHFGMSGIKEFNDKVSIVWHGNYYIRKLKTNTAIYQEKGQQTVELQVKVNSINWAGVGVRFKYFEVYGSFLDITITNIATKESANPGKFLSDWNAFYEKKRSFNFGQTLHAALILPMGKVAAFELRGSYQTFWFPTRHGTPFRPENLSLTAILAINIET
jgi:hypothetical protein